MASGSSGRPNSAPKAFNFDSDDILRSFEDYGKQDASNGSHNDPVSVPNSGKDFHKSRLSTIFPAAGYAQPDDSISQDAISAIENCMKKHSDNLFRFLEGISSRLSQLELVCYNLDKSVVEMRSDLARDHEEADSKLKSLEKHLQEVHRSVQIIRDKQELAETQKDLAKLQVSHKEPSSSSHSQANEERASSVAPDPKKNENLSEIHNQQLSLALPHQSVPQQNPITPPSATLPPNVPQQQSYYISSTQLPGQPPHIQHAQGQYISPDSQHRASQPQDVSQMTNPQLSQSSPQPFNQYQQQWGQPPSQPPQQPHQPSMQPQIRPPPTSVYSYPPNQPTPMPETLSSSMPMQMSYASIPQPGSSRMDPVPYGYAPTSGGGSAPQQPPPVKNAYGPAGGEGYMPPGQQPALSSGGAYMMYDRESGRPTHPPSQQPHFNQGGYHHAPANAPHQPQAATGPHGSARNPSHTHLIEKLVGMGFRGDHVGSVIQRMEDSGQPIDFNGVLDKLSSSASPGTGSGQGPQRAW